MFQSFSNEKNEQVIRRSTRTLRYILYRLEFVSLGHSVYVLGYGIRLSDKARKVNEHAIIPRNINKSWKRWRLRYEKEAFPVACACAIRWKVRNPPLRRERERGRQKGSAIFSENLALLNRVVRFFWNGETRQTRLAFGRVFGARPLWKREWRRGLKVYSGSKGRFLKRSH